MEVKIQHFVVFLILGITNLNVVRAVKSCYSYSPSSKFNLPPATVQCTAKYTEACSTTTFNINGVLSTEHSCATNASCLIDNIAISLSVISVDCCYTDNCNNAIRTVTTASPTTSTRINNGSQNYLNKCLIFIQVLVFIKLF